MQTIAMVGEWSGAPFVFRHFLKRLGVKTLPPGRPLETARPLLIGHRGCMPKAENSPHNGYNATSFEEGSTAETASPPENTLEAFELALANGADGFELDTRLTKDGVPVVFHDCHVGRCLALDGSDVRVADLTLEELQELPFKNSSSVFVPTLDSAIALANKRRAKILIETKDIHHPAELAAQVVALIEKHDMLEDALVISFDPFSLYQIRKAHAGVRTCLLSCKGLLSHYRNNPTEETLPTMWKLVWPLLDMLLEIMVHPSLLPSFLGASAVGLDVGEHHEAAHLKAAKERGISTYFWVVNDNETLEKLADREVFAYSTDHLWPAASATRTNAAAAAAA